MGGIDRTIGWEKVIVHVDMDAFFAAIEIRNDPHLKGKPVIVGGDTKYRSVVSTCSYEARKYGVKSAMPMAEAKRLCPEGVIVSGNLNEYVYTSAVLQSIFGKYSPIVEPFSVDEAFLDITGCHKMFGSAENLVKAMKNEIKHDLGLSCSVGISPNKMLAKMASGENKPDGLTFMDKEDFKKIFYPRPVNTLWGIGESTKLALNKIGIFTVEDLAKRDRKELKKFFGENGSGMSDVAHAHDDTEVFSYDDRPLDKSMSHETTLIADISEIEKIYSTLLWLSDKVARRLRLDNYHGRTISVKIRSSDFTTITRDKTLTCPTDQCAIIYETAKKLIPREFGPKTKVRLLGVRVSNLEKKRGENQLSLVNDLAKNKMIANSKTIDILRDKFGESVISYASTKL